MSRISMMIIVIVALFLLSLFPNSLTIAKEEEEEDMPTFEECVKRQRSHPKESDGPDIKSYSNCDKMTYQTCIALKAIVFRRPGVPQSVYHNIYLKWVGPIKDRRNAYKYCYCFSSTPRLKYWIHISPEQRRLCHDRYGLTVNY